MHLNLLRPRILAPILGSALMALPLSCAPEKAGAKSTESAPTSAPSSASLGGHPAFAKGKSSGTAIADVAERVTPSVVSISATKVTKASRGGQFRDPLFRRFFGPGQGPPRDRREQGLGSGVIVSADGLVLTNHHVINDAEAIIVQTADEREFQVDVVGSDKKSDLALLRLKGKVSGLRPLPLGDSQSLRLGEVVLAIGNPFGVGQTVTMGIVSAKGRADVGIVDYEDFIQTDAAINPGNSGGALVNMKGQLVGINTAILSRTGGNNGIGFAIPSNMVKPIMDSLLKTGKVVRGWLGIGIQDINQEMAQALKLESNRGVLVSDVQDSSPAAKAGLQRGDVILSVNGTRTDSTGHLRNLVAAAGANSTVKVELLRDGSKRTLSANLGELPNQEVSLTGHSDSESGLGGLSLETLQEKHRSQLALPSEFKSGVVVTGVQPGSPASRHLRPGDIILEANRKAVQSPRELEKAIEANKGSTLLLVYRDGSTVFVTLSNHD